MENLSKEVIVYKLQAQQNKPTLGYLRAVAAKDGDSYIELDALNFCPSKKIFVTRDYEEIDNKFKEFELFKVTVIESMYDSEDTRPERNCKYVTKASEASTLKPREMVEIIVNTLPNPNEMTIGISKVPSTSYIYINDDGTCYGPFKWDQNEGDENNITLRKIDSPMPGRQLAGGNIYSAKFEDLNKHVLHCSLEEGERFYFENLTDLHNDTHLLTTDYSSDEDIVNNFIKIAKDIGFNDKKVDLASIEAKIKKFPRYNHKSFTEKLNKLKDISDTHLLFESEVIDGFSKFLRTELGEKVTKKYIDKNEDNYLSNIRDNYRGQLEDEFRKNNGELENLQEKIEFNKQELIDLGKEIEKANHIKVNSDVIDNLKVNEDLDQKVTQKKEQLIELNEQVKPLLEKYKKLSSLNELEKKIEEATNEYKIEVKRQGEIEKETSSLKALFNEHEDKLRNRLLELKPFVEAINGNIGLSNKEISKNVSQHVTSIDMSNSTAQDILKYIDHSMRKEDRNFSILDIINITVTLQQSFICFLAGLPGGGKTTLARLVAKIYGIQQQRFLEIPVARSWTGQKDLIGFFNPISNKFQSSSTGLYEFLYALSEEDKLIDLPVPISLVLLDEANLSPLEHYWSSFMGLTDPKESKKLTLGDNQIQIPENLRFIATINYDSTTEYLSPRLIDRSPIIVLEPNSITTSIGKDIDEEHPLEMPIPYEIMEKCFGKTKNRPEFIENEYRIYGKVKKVLEERNGELGKPIIISSRKEIAIKQYCNRARPLMREFSIDDKLSALDYAVLQMILPLLRGHGKNFSKRLSRLREVLSEEELDRSVDYLDTIISNGNADLHTYDFFCW
ncbi:ATP-binding protein [Psychrobacter glacincola]|uniref:AAA+ ATPase domain-containing protein n=2 Tax=Psychrobacter TaxID=497 RepID=A0ABW1W6I4_9GAMM|nr:ATP-binding protein [Psychrobacter glacincola]